MTVVYLLKIRTICQDFKKKMTRHSIYFDTNGERLEAGDWVTVNGVERTIVREDDDGVCIYTEEEVETVVKSD